VTITCVAAGLSALTACHRDACLQTQRAVAVRTYDCTGNWDVAEGRSRRLLVSPSTCLDEESRNTRCANAILDLSCEEVRAFGDDLTAWLAVDDSCSETFDLGGAGDPGVGGEPQQVVVPSDSCDCPDAVGEEEVVSFINETDLQVQLHEVVPGSCEEEQTAYSVLPFGIGSLPLADGGVYVLRVRNDDDALGGCFTASPGQIVRIVDDS